ncbi:hypothetical protein [Bradyrhizobium sp. CW1]|uniref:hypothetical protein n=1 Tax=Bradyrhizobium sp. CW1 TaxID=2782686 RepID=UPI001FFE8A1E|nr:hypothetical protein [Bradyrhizobium sp. CW1]UPJ27082.1 hypothetical protein IVB54_36660 [Bradyrhizobium sp. CW1]
MTIELHNLPADLAEPPREAIGLVSFQPSTGKIWQKVNGEWLPSAEANAILEAREKSQ